MPSYSTRVVIAREREPVDTPLKSLCRNSENISEDKRKEFLTKIGAMMLSASENRLHAPTMAPWILEVLHLPVTATETEAVAEIQKLKAQNLRRIEVLKSAADELVADAEYAGKIAPHECEWLRERARADLATMTAFVKHRRKVFTGEATRRHLTMFKS